MRKPSIAMLGFSRGCGGVRRPEIGRSPRVGADATILTMFGQLRRGYRKVINDPNG